MALIKCSECGGVISNQSKNCIHCGCPVPLIKNIEGQSNEGFVVVYGFTQPSLTDVKIYLDGVFFDTVKAGTSIEIKINKDTEIVAKCGVRKAKYIAKTNKFQKLQLVFDKLWGTIIIREIDYSTNN